MIQYQANNPYPVATSFLSRFFAAFSASSHSSSVGKLILQAQLRKAHKVTQNYFQKLTNQNKQITVDNGFVLTHDGASLETVELTPTLNKQLSEQQKYYVIKFNGNGGMIHDLLEYSYLQEATKLNASIVAFDYRGVNHSEKSPTCFQDLVTDGIAQVQRLLDKEVDAEKITLDGISLGAAVATLVASHFHKSGLKVSLINDRSFGMLTSAAAGMFAPNIVGFIGDSLHGSSQSSLWSVMKPSGWEANIIKAYESIPSEYKCYIYVTPKAPGDGVIAHRASLHEGVITNETKTGELTGNAVMTSRDAGHNQPRARLISVANPELTAENICENFVVLLRSYEVKKGY